jgi:hypothetical protein
VVVLFTSLATVIAHTGKAALSASPTKLNPRSTISCRSILWLAVVLSAGSLTASGDAATLKRQNVLSAVSPDQNPYNYIYGSVVKGNLIRDDKGRYAINVTFQPRYASELFTENVLFCGNRADVFNGIEGPVVVTYKRVPHQLVQGVPCFDLVTVDQIDAKKGPIAGK